MFKAKVRCASDVGDAGRICQGTKNYITASWLVRKLN